MEACTDCKLEARQQFEAGEDNIVQAVNMNIAHPELGTAGIHIPVPVNAEEKREVAYIKTLNVTEDRLWQGKCEYNECQSFPSRLPVIQILLGIVNS
jgi:mannosyl-oligosaccharide glucosidase